MKPKTTAKPQATPPTPAAFAKAQAKANRKELRELASAERSITRLTNSEVKALTKTITASHKSIDRLFKQQAQKLSVIHRRRAILERR